jgi:hypothetical protein
MHPAPILKIEGGEHQGISRIEIPLVEHLACSLEWGHCILALLFLRPGFDLNWRLPIP